ncbi:hypothetical protein UNDYM_1914 [Undibacterium sp. YM2]|uniref:hypothetical protein n=1 Tax=Undibacterium sp. YM2 TaxID=2058625 RepID=UPI001331E3C8|nr:hypothetical protein [Undibacterium sp. YM2]BBB66167.1 hypothetical protein UNDYM_1914 [Undibacterium sp. YM2]
MSKMSELTAEEVISLMIASKMITYDEATIRLCLNCMTDLFLEEDSRFHLKNSYVTYDLASQVSLILEPDDEHMTLYYVAGEIEDAWCSYCDVKNFQIGQIERFREVSVFRFVDTTFLGKAVTGTIYIMGDNYAKLSDQHVEMGHYIDSWVGTKSHQRFLAEEEKYSVLARTSVTREALMRARRPLVNQ